jgi:16S rRNA (adenine1518-N6/adenine1519-N6)-dimethyltransferase
MSSGRPPDHLPPPRRRFAQHFLRDRRILQRIVDALGPDPASTVVEIGPGRGALTDLLVERSGRVVAIEIDRDLAELLRERYADRPNVQVIEGDALALAWGTAAGGPYLLAGNLPYNLTTPLLFKSLEAPAPRRAVFLVQLEVAQRLMASEGGKEYGALTVNLRVALNIEMIARVPAGAFHPRPAVDSAIIRLSPRAVPLLDTPDTRRFREFTQRVFAMRRKQLQRVLRANYGWDAPRAAAALLAIGVEPAARPETLPVERLVALFRQVDAFEDRTPDD